MSAGALGPGARTRVRRVSKKARYEETVIYEILDQARLCHVAALVGDRPVALPTLHAREGRTVFLHGSPSNEVMKAVLREGEAFVTATLFEGLRLARTGFHSSIAFRSVVVVGRAREIVDESEKLRVLNLFIDRILPGRAGEVRAISTQELRLTTVVAVAIDEASAKVSTGPTDDDDADLALPIWAGTVPARLVFEAPRPDVNGAMSNGDVEVPPSVRRLLDEQ